MKIVLVLMVLGALAYFGYGRLQADNPQHIENPVYAEIKVDAKIAGRELNMVLYGQMVDEEDCRERTSRVWDKVLACPDCVMTSSTCKAELEPRYLRLFEDAQIHSTYLAFTRGDKYERDGRMVIYGLTADESAAVCDSTRAEFQKRYTGAVECIVGRRD